MTDFIVLGFLSYGFPLTAYDIKKAMETSTQLFMTTSLGSIHPSLVRMTAQGWLEWTEKLENGRSKKYYTITRLGEEQFKIMLHEDIKRDRLKIDILLKMFHFSSLTKAERFATIDQHILHHKETIEMLRSIEQQKDANMKCHGVSIEEFPQADYQFDALQFGIDYSEFTIKWFTDYKEKLKERT